LATTLKAKDLFRGEEFDLGFFGTVSTPAAVETIVQSDCIIAFGASLNSKTLSGKALPMARGSCRSISSRPKLEERCAACRTRRGSRGRGRPHHALAR